MMSIIMMFVITMIMKLSIFIFFISSSVRFNFGLLITQTWWSNNGSLYSRLYTKLHSTLNTLEIVDFSWLCFKTPLHTTRSLEWADIGRTDVFSNISFQVKNCFENIARLKYSVNRIKWDNCLSEDKKKQ